MWQLSHITGKMNGGASQGSPVNSPSTAGMPGLAGLEQLET